MVGHQTLNLAIGVRVPASQPFKFNSLSRYFLWIAAALSASTAEQPRINDRDFPVGLTTLVCCRRTRAPGADYDEVKTFSSSMASCSGVKRQSFTAS